MAKLIIIDDEYIMVKMIQGQLGRINPAFAELDTNGSCKNVLCLTDDGKEYQFTNFNPNGDDPDAFTSVFQDITPKDLEKLLYQRRPFLLCRLPLCRSGCFQAKRLRRASGL